MTSVIVIQRRTYAPMFSSSYLYLLLLLMSVFRTGISSVKADVRCYCNLPVCVTSGYMCKSSLGVCVSDYFGHDGNVDRTDFWRSRHSCLELVQTRQLEAAALECSEAEERSAEHPKTYPSRMCCREDMCNYARSEEHNYMTGYFLNDEYLFLHGAGGPSGTPSQHLWFKAAVIAVPIAGGFILILLIVMAVRMLKEDQKRHRGRPSSISPHRTGTVDTKVVYSGEAVVPSGLLFLPKSLSSAVITVHPQIHKEYSSASAIDQQQKHLHHNSVYSNVSIAMSTDTSCTDTSREKYFVFDV